MKNREYCNSCYLAFRWIPKQDICWSEAWKPVYPVLDKDDQTSVETYHEVEEFIENYLKSSIDNETGILLSGGIDSAILASFLPENTKAYTIKFIAKGAIDESIIASQYAKKNKLDHKVVTVTWKDYLRYMPVLMRNKKAPLHAVEVGLYKAARQANKDGISKLVIGNGADSTFGGMDKLLSKDWNFDEFVKRYSFIMPNEALVNPVSILDIYEEYKEGNNKIDYISFLKYTHGLGVVQAFDNAIRSADCKTIEPYEHLKLETPLDLNRIRNGEPKYILYELFRKRYPDMMEVKKIPFARPMDQWLKDWSGPRRSEFLQGCIGKMTGDQKYLVYTLEMFLNLIDEKGELTNE